MHKFSPIRALAFCAGALCVQAVGAAALSGRVTDLASGQPMANVTVVASAGAFPLPTTSAQATTDAQGNYSLAFDCTFSCSVGTSVDGYLATGTAYPSSAPVVVVDIALVREATVSGRVVLPAGYAFDEIALSLQRHDPVDGSWNTSGVPRTRVGEDGYRFSKIPAGTYRMCYLAQDLLYQCFDGANQGATATLGHTPIALAAGDARNEVNLTPQPGVTVGGRIVDGYAGADSGVGFVGTILTFYDESGAPMPRDAYLDADAAGDYTGGVFAPGRYYVVANDSRFQSRVYPGIDCAGNCDPVVAGGQLVTVPAGGLSGLNFAMSPYAVARARVRDAATGAEIPNAQFGAWTYMMGPGIALPNWRDASTGEYVAYATAQSTRLGARAPGYVARFVNGGNCTQVNILVCAGDVPLARNEVRTLELRLYRADDYLFAGDFE
ncbi:MAG TPA: carboxypeptidase regulatory-like domain-containing protein [Tahibacter sp.]|nr:carboxypeptidase regulatory-like domain-containing protein [Tahibacter sp.]